MANQGLNPRKVVVIYTREADGTWRRDNVTTVQGGVATVTTSTGADLDTVKLAAYAANPVQTIHSEHVIIDDYA